ncbi:MAG: PspC domain-containing protein [Ferruginibacter sp.]
MKQVININFQGRVVPIEVSAFDILKQYTDSLNRYFANENGKEEIINDIENRIGELFQERLKTGATCITDEHVNAIIKSMGRPEDFEEAETDAAPSGSSTAENQGNSSTHSGSAATGFHYIKSKRLYRSESDKVIGGVCSGLANYFGIDVVVVRIIFAILFFSFGFGLLPYIILWVAVPSTATTQIGAPRKKLFRDNDDKIIAGVCSGIANYFGINVWIPRVLFLLPFLSFIFRWNNLWGSFPDIFNFSVSPGALFVYIILWLVIPEANTTAEKLEMKGEKVDMNSIKNSVMEEMKGFQQRAKTFGQEAKAFAEEKGQVLGSEVEQAAKKSGKSLGDIIAMLFKIFAYFIIGSILIALVIALFVFGVVSVGLFPAKDFLLNAGWQSVFAWGTLIFFIAIPIIGIITWIIRRLANIKTNRKLMRTTFAGLWLVGLVCFIALLLSIGKEFRSNSPLNEEQIILVNPTVQKLEVTTLSPDKKYFRNNWYRMEPFEGIEEDTAYVRNVTVEIVQSKTDSFMVTLLKLANGADKRIAEKNAYKINYNAYQSDSLLVLDRGVEVNKTDKFRNQRVIVTVYVPIGKQIRINESVGWGNNIRVNGPWISDWDIETVDVERGWNKNTDYIMQQNGLHTLDGKPADEWGKNNSNKRTNKNGNINLDEDSNYRYNDDNRQKAIDSIKLDMKRDQQRRRDSLQKMKEKLNEELKLIDAPKISTIQTKPNNKYVLQLLPAYNPMKMMLSN